MRSHTVRWWFVLPVLVGVACSADLTRDNRYDPNGSGDRASGRIAGMVFVLGESSAHRAVYVFDQAGARVDGGALVTDEEGAFLTADLAPGLYDVQVDVPLGNVPIRSVGIEVLPGLTTDLGLLVSVSEPPIGAILGAVEMSESSLSPAGVRVVATKQGLVGGSHVTYSNAGGEFAFSQLIPGTYELVADRSGLTPDLVDVTVPADDTQATTPSRPLVLHPVSGVVLFRAQTATDTGVGLVVGAPYTSDPDVDLLMLAFGGVNEMRYSESPDFFEGGVEVDWVAHIGSQPYTLSAGEGEKTIFAQFRLFDVDNDVERLRTETYVQSIVRDESPPDIISFEVAPGALDLAGVRYFAGDITSVPVAISAVDAYSRVRGYRLIDEGVDPDTVAFQDLTSTSSTIFVSDTVQLSSGDGIKPVRLQLRDGAGNVTEVVTRSVMVDNTAPTEGTVTVLGSTSAGASSSVTMTRAVTVSLSGFADNVNGSGLAAYMLSDSPVFAGASWTECQGAACNVTDADFLLGPLDGPTRVYARVRDAAGKISEAAQSDPITLDTTGPSSPSIGALASITKAAQIDVSLFALDATSYQVSVDPLDLDFENPLLVPTAMATASVLAPVCLQGGVPGACDALTAGQDGVPYVVFARYYDDLGNSSAIVQASILVDNTLPTISSVVLDDGAAFTRSVSVVLEVDADGATQMRVSTDGVFNAELWVPLASTSTQLLPPVDCVATGCKSACVHVRDDAGNETVSPVCDTITLDMVPPSTPILTTPPQVVNVTPTPTFTIGTAGAVIETFFARYEVLSQPTDTVFQTASTTQSTTSFSVTLREGTAGQGGNVVNTIRLRAVDLAGNLSPEAAVLITEDSVAPDAPSIVSVDGQFVNSDAFAVYMGGTGAAADPNFDHYEVSGGVYATWTVTPARDALLFGLVQGDGTACSAAVPCANTLRVRGVDKADNVGPVATLIVNEDSTAPTAPRLGPIDAHARASSVRMRLYERSLDNGTATEVYTYQLEGGQYAEFTDTSERDLFAFDLAPNRANRFCVRGRDRAGNVGIESCSTVTEQTSRALTATGTEEREVDMAGDYVVFTGRDANGEDVARLHDLTTGLVTDLEPSATADQTKNAHIALTTAGYVVVFENKFGGNYVQARMISLADGGLSSMSVGGDYPDTDGVDWVFNASFGVCSGPGNVPGGICRPSLWGTRGNNLTGTFVSADRAYWSGPRVFDNRVVWTRCIAQDGSYNCCTGGGCPPNSAPTSYRLARAVCTELACTVDEPATLPAPTQPVIGSGYIAWTQVENVNDRNGTLYYMARDGAVGSAVNTGITGVGTELDIEGNRIAYATRVGIGGDLFLYIIGDASPVRQLTSTLLSDESPAISGARVAWSQHGVSGSDVYLMELNETRWEHVAQVLRVMPEVLDDHIVWLDANALGQDSPGLMALRRSTGEQFRPADFDDVISFNGDRGPPSIARGGGSYLAWIANTPPSVTVKVRNLVAFDPDTQLPAATVVSTSGVPVEGAVALRADGGQIAWLEDAGATTDIYVSSLPTVVGTLAVTSVPAKQNLEVAGGVIVWEQPASGATPEIHCSVLSTGVGGLVVADGQRPRLAGTAGTLYLVWEREISLGGWQSHRDVRGCVLTCSATPTCAVRDFDTGLADQSNIDVDASGRTTWVTNARPGSYTGVVLGSMTSNARVSLSVANDGAAMREHPILYGNQVFWMDDRFGAPDIFVYTIDY